MRFSINTEEEEIDLALSQTATTLWLQSIEADKRSEDGARAQCLRDGIRHLLEGAAASIPGNENGTYRVLWGREQVLAVLPKAKDEGQ
jgi:hypothetical protein